MTISVRNTLQWIEGKPMLSELKTETSRRVLSLPDIAVVTLLKHQHRQEEEKQKLGDAWKNDWDLVFTTGFGTPLHEVHVSRSFHIILKKAELPYIRFYDLRHTCASLLVAQDVHPRLIMDQLGHSDINITMTTYSHIMQSSRQETAKKMNDLLFPIDEGKE